MPKKFKNVAVVDNIVSDPVLNHKWKPNTKFIDKRTVPYFVYVNGQSWPEKKDIEIEKSKGTIRIFYVGDSNTQGPLDYDSKMVTIVGKKLNEKFKNKKKIEVINTGTSSWSPSIYYLEIKNHILNYSPDIIVINVDMTDVGNDFDYHKLTEFDSDHLPVKINPAKTTKAKEVKRSIFQQRINSFREFLVNNSSFYYNFENFVLFLKHKIKRTANIEPNIIFNDENIKANWLAQSWNNEIQENVNYSMFVLDSTVKLLKENNVKVILTGVPHYPQFTGEWSIRPHEEIKKVALNNNVYFLDTFAQIKKLENKNDLRKDYWEEDPTHFNIRGNRLWAQIQYSFLIDPTNKLIE